MASAQLSSPRRTGAGSDLKETAPAAPGALLGERRAGRRGRLAADPLQQPRPGRAVPPPRALTQAQPSSLPAVQRPMPKLPRAPSPSTRSHYPSAGGRGLWRAPGLNFPRHLPSSGAPWRKA